ncbi:CHAT domain-containing protein [Scytonema sp. UIC 10036]|uniref:CHAT domain-containing protein n=1 Tax=Scytonema sp. UIC 10036 TaxID=2304196 RepID=UPI0012DA6233|nr:CHAT domain-containing protein [Scytonema sp. UIC 10036]MUG97443.1 CHAT domain-containing protein [Scytonema sp. UIC 10036]
MNMRNFKLYLRKRSHFFMLAIIVFYFTIATTPIVAQITEKAPVIQSQNNGLQLAAQAKYLYQNLKFSESAEVWQKASHAFARVGDKTNQAMALSNLSLTYQQLGKWQAAKEAIKNSLNLLPTSDREDQRRVLAKTLEIQGKLQLATGDASSALSTWQQATKIYSELYDTTGSIQNQMNQAQAFQALGLYRRAITILNDVKQTLQTQPDSSLKARALLSLGNTLSVSGDLQKAEDNLQQSLKIAQSLQPPQDKSDIYLSMGNLARFQKKIQEAINYYKQAENSSSLTLQVRARLNNLNLLVETQQWQLAQAMWNPILEQLNNLPASSANIYARMHLAQSLICLKQPDLTKSELNSPILQQCVTSNNQQISENSQNVTLTSITPISNQNLKDIIQNPKSKIQNRLIQNPKSKIQNLLGWSDIEKLLITASEQAQTLQDKRAEAYALGYRGAVYQQKQNLPEADTLTRQALNLAMTAKAPDIAYRWQWQLGRIAKSRKDSQNAISAYTDAFKNLQSLRGDLVATNPDIQFSFRESVEPVYRELVDLLLKEKQPNLKLAREVIESLQLAELDDFFREACIDAKPEQIDQIVDKANPRTAVFYAFFLQNSLEVILKLPGDDLQHYSTPLEQNLAKNTIAQLQQALTQIDRTKDVQRLSKEVYNWIIAPVREKLNSSQVKTLVFVLDGALRNIPMGVLYDGQKYLVEKYAIALTPGLQLLSPRPLAKIELSALTAGVSEERKMEGQEFDQLVYVESELREITSQVRGSKQLLNELFTKPNLQRQINQENYAVVHLATHGQFSSDPDKTFLLLWDNLLKARELNNLLRSTDTNQNRKQTIELLVLSACQTASGDERAALGLAGVAIRAGARSTVATLWPVIDESTSLLMKQFYKELTNPNITKVQALQNAQIALLKEKEEPYYWASYTLVGNWL